MKRSHLIVVYFIFYMAVLVTCILRLMTMKIAGEELKRIDNAIDTAGNKTAEVLNNHVYEDNPEELLRKTFIYSFMASMQEDDYTAISNSLIRRIYVGVNGELLDDYGKLKDIKDSDSLAIYVVLNDLSISTPLRKFVVSREYYKELERK